MATIQRGDPNVLTKGAFWTLVSISALFLSLRLYCKRRGRGLHWDDTVLIASWVALLGNVVLMTIIFDKVAAQTRPPTRTDIDTFALLGLCALTLAVASQSLSKVSFAMTLLRISEGWMSCFLWFAIVSMNVLFGLGALFFWISCTPLEKAWHPLIRGTCRDPSFHIVFGIVISGYSGVMDLVFALIPWKIIMPLNLRPKEKLGCAIAMSMGIFAGIAAFMKCSRLPSIASGSTNDMRLAFWGVAEPAVSIMAACVPAMRILFRKVTAPKQELMDEEERDAPPEPPSDHPSHGSTNPATWGTKLATWASATATWGSTVATWSRTGKSSARTVATEDRG